MASRPPASEKEATFTLYSESYYQTHHLNLCNPPSSLKHVLRDRISGLLSGYDKCQCPDRNIAPEPLIINDAYGVTIGDIITASVPYFAAHKEDILKAESWLKGDEAWHPEDDEGNIRPLPSNSQIYLTSLVPGGFMFEDVTGNGEMLAELWVQAARLAIRRKDEGYTVVAAGEVPERVIGRIDAVPMTD